MNPLVCRAVICATLALLLALCVPAPAQSPPVYAVITDLGTLGGTASSGFGVNNKGQVAGSSRLAGDKDFHGFLWDGGKLIDLGTLGGRDSEASALNDAGQVTGNADTRNHVGHAFLWQNGHMADLDTGRYEDSAGGAINSAGDVAGNICHNRPPDSVSHACFWSGGKRMSLDDFGAPSSSAGALNNHGQIVGSASEPGRRATVSGAPFLYFADHALLWQGRKAIELNAPSMEVSMANAINDAGQVVGAISVGREMLLHACCWQNGKATDLGIFGNENTVLNAVNRAGLMVGSVNPDEMEQNGKPMMDKTQPQFAFCYSVGRLINLNTLLDPQSDWYLTEARGVSDTGYVTGTGIHNGLSRAFLLKLPAGF